MQIVDIQQAGGDLSSLIHRAMSGESVMLVRANQPLVRIEPAAVDDRPRVGGIWKGQVWMSPDFDAPLKEFEFALYGPNGAPHEAR